MLIIGVVASNARGAARYLTSIHSRGAATKLILPKRDPSVENLLAQVQGLLLTGGPDVSPACYDARPQPGSPLDTYEARDGLELPLARIAIQARMPVLGICRGMQVINVVMGGKLIQDIPSHKERGGRSTYHQVYLSPGSKLGAILGTGGFFRVNSRHHQGVKESYKAPSLMASAYSLHDGIIEALESPDHPFLVGVQWHPEREEEVPKIFPDIFLAFLHAVQKFNKGAVH